MMCHQLMLKKKIKKQVVHKYTLEYSVWPGGIYREIIRDWQVSQESNSGSMIGKNYKRGSEETLLVHCVWILSHQS